MDLLDRYLEAVRKYLPWQRQDDIIAELRANLEAQLEEKEAALGRPLARPEAETWIKSLGSPMRMAAPYQSQQYLIGPAIFPIYLRVLKLSCSWAVIIYAVVSSVEIFAAPNPSGTQLLIAFLRVPFMLIWPAAWCTLIFAAIEFAVTHGHLRPEKLGPLAAGWAPTELSLNRQVPGKKPRSYAQAVVEAVFGIFFLAWLLLIPKHPWLLMGPGAYYLSISPYQLAPVWMQFYWCVVALNLLQVGMQLECLMRGGWRQLHPVRQIVYKSIGLLACIFLLTGPDHALILLKHPALDQAHYGATLHQINFYVYRSFLLVTAIAAVQLAWDLGRISLNSYRKRAAAQ